MRLLIVRNNGLFLGGNRDENRTLFYQALERICVLARKKEKRFSLYKGDKLSPIRLVPVELRSNNEIERGEKKKRLEHQLTKGQVIFSTHPFRFN